MPLFKVFFHEDYVVADDKEEEGARRRKAIIMSLCEVRWGRAALG